MPRDLATQLATDLDDHQLLVIVSSDCDVASSDLDKEPLFEVVLMNRVDEPNGNFTHGKNPRRLHLQVSSSQEDQYYEADIDDRSRFNRAALEGWRPSQERWLEHDTTRVLKLWVSKRYNRAAFPDVFNERISPVIPMIKKEFRTGGRDIDSVWFGLSTMEELPPEDSYRVQFICVMKVGDYAVAEKRDAVQTAFDQVLAVLAECDGVQVENEGVFSESDITVDDLRALLRWDWDDLTLRHPDEDPPLPGTEI